MWLLLVPFLACDSLVGRGEVNRTDPLVGGGLRIVTDLDLTSCSTIELLVCLVKVVSDPLVENLSSLEQLCGHLESKVEEPSIRCTLSSIEFVATTRTLEATALRSITKIV